MKTMKKRGEKMIEQIALTGNESVALAMKQINPDVLAAYPITPQTEIVQLFSQFIADGELDTEYITVESEHSAMSATVGASAAGARALTATSANGLAYMMEIVYIASSLRLPIVMTVVNRALSGPINIHCDHSDAMAARDSGWIQLFGENAQSAYDNMIQAVRIAEIEKLPVMVNMDGFIISHAVENIRPLSDELVKKFLGEYEAKYRLLDSKDPVTFGPLDLQDYYFEHKRQESHVMESVMGTVLKVAGEYKEISDRNYSFLEDFMINDADIILIGLGSTMGTARVAAENIRKKGIKAGVINLRLFRPFPGEKLREILADKKIIGVLDRADTFSLNGGPLYSDILNVLYEQGEKKIVNYIYGLGGRDISISELEDLYIQLDKLKDSAKIENRIQYIGVRE